MVAKKKPYGKDAPPPEDDLWFDAREQEQKDKNSMSDDNSSDDNRRTFVIVVSIFVLLIFGAVLGYLYYQKNIAQEGEPPLITAETGPVKTRPDDPGGMEVAHQDRLIFDKVSGEETELEDNIQPAPEQPLTDLDEDKSIADLIAETEPDPAPTRSAAIPPAMDEGGYIIQLGAFGQKTGAENAWAILEQRYVDTIGSLTPEVQEFTTAEGRTLYRLRAGYFATRDQAVQVCDTLKALGQDCLATTR